MEIKRENVGKVLVDTILVEIMKQENKTKAGIILPGAEMKFKRKDVFVARVIDIGVGVSIRVTDFLKPGEFALLNPVTLDCPGFKDGEVQYVFIKEDDIICQWKPTGEDEVHYTEEGVNLETLTKGVK